MLLTVKKGRTNKIPQTGTFTQELNKINFDNKLFNTLSLSNYNDNKHFSSANNIQILPSSGLINKMFLPYLKQIKRDEIKTKTRKNIIHLGCFVALPHCLDRNIKRIHSLFFH